MTTEVVLIVGGNIPWFSVFVGRRIFPGFVDRSSFEGGCGIRLDESGTPALEKAAERPPPPCARVHGGTSGGSIRGRRCGGSSGSSFFSSPVLLLEGTGGFVSLLLHLCCEFFLA